MKVRRRIMSLIGVLFMMVVLTWAGAAYAQEVIEFVTSETDPASVEVQKAWADEFQKEHPTVQIALDFVAFEDLEKKAVVGVAGGNPPHILGLDFWMAASYAKRGLLQPLDDMIQEVGVDKYFKVALECVIDGKIYAVPYALTPTVKYYRVDWYEETGLVPAITWEDHLDNVRKLTIDTDGDGMMDRYGSNIVLGSKALTAERFLENYGTQNGIHYFDEMDRLVMDESPNLERLIELAEWYREMRKYSPPGVAGYAWAEHMAAYYTGKAAHGDYGGRLFTRLITRATELAGPNKTKAMLIPYGPNGQYRGGNAAGGWQLMANVKYPEIAKEFLKFITTGDRAIQMCLTVPTHLIPPLKADAWNSKLIFNPWVQVNPQIYRKILEANSVSHTLMYDPETGVHPDVYALYQEPAITMIQRIVVYGEDPENAIKKAAEEIRDLLRK